MLSRQDLQHDVSAPLRDLARVTPALQSGPTDADDLKVIPLPSGFKPSGEPDTVLQKNATGAPSGPATTGPTAGLNFEGLGTGFPNFPVHVAPPDTNGAVGLTQYVQWVNLSFVVFDKATGNVVLGPMAGNTLWQGFGGGCEADNDGDPIVTYDKLADRWVFSQFVVRNQPFLQCVAVSTTPDATGTYNRYSFQYSNFNDYPKLGVWPDAYYITFNIFNSNNAFSGADACAYDRNAMLNGQAATQVCFQQASTVGSLLPADIDGHVPPPAGSPNFMMDFGVNSLNLYKFHVDFVTPANSTFTGPVNILVAPFTPFCPNVRGCIPQPPGDGTRLDSLGDRLMYRLAYRNFSDHESLVVNHSVVADPTNQNSGVRWYEIQNPNGAAPIVAQQSTFAPDGSFRWMGSVAMDVSGDLAVGYSVVNSTSVPPVFPSVAFAARAASDPVSTLQPETSLVTGAGSQTFGLTRWGDYSAMQVDPQDDCTFWYTTEYLQNSGSFNWNTRIGSFRFPDCGVPQLKVTSTHTGNFTQGQTGATYTLLVSNIGGKDTDGTQVTVTDILPSGLTATALSGTNWTCTLNTLVCNRTDVLAKASSYEPITLTVNVASSAPALVTNNATAAGGGDKVTESGSDSTTIIQTGADLAITKTHSGFFIQGQTGTYTIAVANVGLSSTDGTTVTVADTLPSGLTASSAAGTGWTCSLGATVSCSRKDSLASNASYSAITLIVNVANSAAGKLTNTATVAGGGNVNPLNDSASDPTTVIPPPPDLTITKTHTGNFTQGQSNATYTLTVSNLANSGSTAGSVTVTDTHPAGILFSFASGSGWFCSINQSSAVCTRSDVLLPGKSYPPITLGANVAGDAPASIINTATVSGGGDISPGNNTASDPTTINPAPDLTITKSHTPDPFIVGQTGTYTLTVNNIGGAATSGTVTVTDFLPSALTATAITGSGWNCSAPPTQFVTCTRSDSLASTGSYPAITVTVSVNGGGPFFTNTASTGGGGELNTFNDSASDLTHITAAVLAITESHTPEPFTAGQTGTYTINVSNTGKVATVGTVTVTDFLPNGLTATAVSGTGWSCSALPTNFSLTCTQSDSLAAGGSYPPLLITVNVVNTPPTVTNTVNVTGGGDSLSHSASDTAKVNAPTLTITKSHTGDFTVGQIENYKITVGNVGKTATAGTVTLTDFLPLGMSAIATGGTGWNCSPLPTNFLNCTRADSLAINASYPPLTVVVSVTGGGPKTTNTASVTGGGDGNTHSASDPTNINGPVLGITKSHTGDPFIVGQTGTYTITVDNKAGNVATNGTVNVSDFVFFPATSVTGTGWNCSGVTSVNCSRSDSLAAGGTYPPITIVVSVTGGASSFTNVASVSGGGDVFFHSAFDPTNINGPSLAVTKSHTGDPFIVGQTGTYTITVNNKSGKTATTGTVTVQDFLPGGLTATAVTGAGWSCSSLPTTFLNCTRSDSLAAGGTYPSISMTVNVSGGSPSVINNVNVTGGGDPNFHGASDFTNISGPALAISKSHTGDPFIIGQTGTYTIIVDNKAGKAATTGPVTVQDFLPFGMSATAVTATGWSCSGLPTSFLNCTRSDSLAAGGTYPSIVVTVNVTGGGPSVTNTASVNGGGDSNFHSASDLTNISSPVLAITKSHAPDPFIVGQTGTYTLTVSNTGKIATTGTVNVQDPLPNGMTLANFSGTGWGCMGSTFVTCTRSDALAPSSSYPPIVLTVNVGDSRSTATNTASVTGGGDANQHSATDTANVTAPTLAITKTHTGDFTVGQQGSYTITVSNTGSVATTGTVTVADFLPFGLTISSAGGTNWGCTTSFSVVCNRSDSLAPNSSYPPLTVTVNVNGNGFQQTITNMASVTGGGDGNTHVASDPTKLISPTLAITKTHSGNFAVGQSGGTYTITVSNPGPLGTVGTVTVNDAMPQGLTATAVSAAGWNCSFLPSTFVTCSRSDSLAGGASYSPISLTVSVSGTAPGLVINQASLGGGGDPFQHSANDPTSITLPDLAVSLSRVGDLTLGQPGTYTINVSNVGTIPTAGGTLILDDPMPVGLTATAASGTGWTCSILPGPQTELNCTRTADVLAPGSSYPPITLSVNVGRQAPSSITNSVSVFGIAESNFSNNTASDTASATGLLFVPVTPCRVVDTRGANGPFGGPFLSGQVSRGFAIPGSACNIPANAQAYSLNVTVVPHGGLGFLTMYPCGEAVPNSSTLNSDGRVKAVGAIVPAGDSGSVCAFPTQDTDLVLDINGYFVPASTASALAFYPLTPCRLVDTRNAAGPLGGPTLAGASARTFPLLASSCNVPNTAQAYSLNVTTVSKAGIGFLTAWPAGQPQPSASTLNAPSSAAVANAAIVPAGTNGDISIFSTNTTDVILDVNGYFAPPSPGGLSLVPVPPCRILDSRLPAGSTAFTGQLDVNVAASPCGVPATAQAYALNATVVPPGILGFLTLWPQGVAQPNASTLNSDGTVTSNLAIIPTNNGSISTFASSPTFLILDVSGFFTALPPVAPSAPAAVTPGIQAKPGPAGISASQVPSSKNNPENAASQPGVTSPRNAPAPVHNTPIRPSVEPPSTEGGDGSRSEGHGSVQPSNQSEQTEPAKNRLLEQAGWLLRFGHE